VIEGRVSVSNAAGDLRIYDGVAVSPRGRVIGLEVKSGGATRTGSQSAFDTGVNTFNPAVGVGQKFWSSSWTFTVNHCAMRTPTKIKIELLEVLTALVDEPLKQVGFARKKDSLTYSRILNAAEQEITFVMDCFPKYQPGAEAHIHPMFRLRMPEVNEKALGLVNGDKMLLADAPE
jgi:hypothetical protein